MKKNQLNSSASSGAPTDGEVLNTARIQVREMLTKSAAFKALPQDQQRDIANNTVQILRYMAAPEGIPGHRLPAAPGAAEKKDPFHFEPSTVATALTGETGETGQPNADDVRKIGKSKFKAEAAREGAAVAGALLKAVNFPTFVAGLIQGVFHAIVQSSIEQMEAYGKLVADVAKTLNQFRDENVSANQGRDHLADQFPDLFTTAVDPGAEGGPAPRARLRDDVDEDAALKRVNSTLPIEGGPLKSLDLEDPEVENKLVQAARTQLATSRQQLLATMVLMGINRIVVTDGKISAKVLYDFQARDNRRFQRSAAAYDHQKDIFGNLQTVRTAEGEKEVRREGDEHTESHSDDGHEKEDRTGDFYAKGKYKYTDQPVMKAMSAASESTDAALQTKASLAGVVDINFKSDYFPLEKMADSFQIAQIQNAAKPGQTNRAAPAAAATTPAATPTTPAPSPSK